jgi:hypothetical protein
MFCIHEQYGGKLVFVIVVPPIRRLGEDLFCRPLDQRMFKLFSLHVQYCTIVFLTVVQIVYIFLFTYFISTASLRLLILFVCMTSEKADLFV